MKLIILYTITYFSSARESRLTTNTWCHESLLNFIVVNAFHTTFTTYENYSQTLGQAEKP